jgi:hypothetical protein
MWFYRNAASCPDPEIRWQNRAISQNIRDTTATAISSDDTTTGNSRIKFNCTNLNPPPGAPNGFALVPGTFRELSD